MINPAPQSGAGRRLRHRPYPAPWGCRWAWPAVLLALAASLPPAQAQQTFRERAFAVLGGMDKVTGRISTFTLPLDVIGSFGSLEVTPRACRKTPPDEAPESAAFLHIRDWRDGSGAIAFSGWMFASTPGLSALEHPVYDIWVIDCTNEALGERSNSAAAGDENSASAVSASDSSAR